MWHICQSIINTVYEHKDLYLPLLYVNIWNSSIFERSYITADIFIYPYMFLVLMWIYLMYVCLICIYYIFEWVWPCLSELRLHQTNFPCSAPCFPSSHHDSIYVAYRLWYNCKCPFQEMLVLFILSGSKKSLTRANLCNSDIEQHCCVPQ